jgi:hypothetical protein
MPNINHAVLIGTAVEIVYNAITSQEGLSAWWTPNTQTKAELNTIAHFPFGADYFKEMRITELKPFELVRWNCIKGAEEWVGTNISFKLIPGDKEFLLKYHSEILGQIEQQKNNNGTLLIFHHDDWRGYTLMFAECSYTWGQFLKSLKQFCETGKGRPWPYQHRTE